MQISERWNRQNIALVLGAVRLFTAVLLGYLSFSGCANGPKVNRNLTLAEQIREDRENTSGWSDVLTQKVSGSSHIEVEVRLRAIAEKVVAVRPELAISPIGVQIFDLKTVESEGSALRVPAKFSIPGNRIYFSKQLLQLLEFENEFVGALSIELAHILQRHAVIHASRQEALSPSADRRAPEQGGVQNGVAHGAAVDFFSPAGIFAYTLSEEVEAARLAVGLIYQTGYDARGLVSYLRKLQTLEVGVPSGSFIMIEKVVREEMTKLPPLRNPIVQTADFEELRKRMRKL